MNGLNEGLISELAFSLLRKAVIQLPEDVKKALRDALAQETTNIACKQIETILTNLEIAEDKQIPLCQDTGLPVFLVKIGKGITSDFDFPGAITRGVIRASEEIPLRLNTIHPLTKKNTDNNTGWGVPIIHYELDAGCDYLEITAIPKGFGSEMRTSQCWVPTSQDIAEAAMKAVLDVVEDAMGEPCPPLLIGLGIGGTGESSMLAARRALARQPFAAPHQEKYIAELETRLLEAVNRIGLGPMGYGGKNYALGVNIEIRGSHTAIVPISIMFQCWAARHATARVYQDGKVEME